MDEDNPDQTILYEEVARINAERGTNLTVEGILRGTSRHDITWAARLMAWSFLLGLLLFITVTAFVMAATINASAGSKVFDVLLGLVFLGLSFLPARAAWRMFWNWKRELRAIDEMTRRVDARHTAREQGQAE